MDEQHMRPMLLHMAQQEQPQGLGITQDLWCLKPAVQVDPAQRRWKQASIYQHAWCQRAKGAAGAEARLTS